MARQRPPNVRMPRASAHAFAAAAASWSAWRPLPRRGDVPRRVWGGRAAANRHARRGRTFSQQARRAHLTTFPPVPTSDHPPHLVGESAAGSSATAAGGTGGALGPLSAAAWARAPRRRARRFLTPPRVPLIGHPPTATSRLQYPPLGGSGRPWRGAGAGRARARYKSRPWLFFFCVASGRPATPIPRARRLAVGLVATLITQTPNLSPRRSSPFRSGAAHRHDSDDVGASLGCALFCLLPEGGTCAAVSRVDAPLHHSQPSSRRSSQRARRLR